MFTVRPSLGVGVWRRRTPTPRLVAAEQALRASVLTWVVLRFSFVCSDGNGHLEALPTM